MLTRINKGGGFQALRLHQDSTSHQPILRYCARVGMGICKYLADLYVIGCLTLANMIYID